MKLRLPPALPDAPGAQIVALMLTRRCNMTCGHCSVASGPHAGPDPSDEDLLEWVRQVAAARVRSIRFTGGEPMLRASTVRLLAAECRRLGVFTAMTTNGFWGYTPGRARRELRALQRAGLNSLTVSYDAYHADFQGPQPALNIAQAAEEIGFPVTFNVIRGTSEGEVAAVTDQLRPARNARLRVYDLQLVGRARDLPAGSVRDDAEGFCTSCSYPALAETGRLIACTGPAYFESPESPLVIGSIRESTYAELLERYRRDPILNVIRTRGPSGLRAELRRTPGFEDFPFRERYFGICDLCHHITRDGRAVAALRTRLSEPAAVAEQVAAWQVIAGHRRMGELSASHVNGAGACRVFLRAALDPDAAIDADAPRVLGHAHLDWRRLVEYLAGSGLARPLLPALGRQDLSRWAPAFFRDDLSRRGMRDGLRELVQRQAIERIDDALRALGGRGVLLKGAALLMQAPPNTVSRATSDVDILVEPGLARALRRRLLDDGFDGMADAGHSTAQHLEPITLQGMPVEIHTRIMQRHWGLPEERMIAGVRPLPGSTVLHTLGPEAMLVHAAVHLTASFFSFGLKAAWDLLAILDRHPEFDWDRLLSLVSALDSPRAFWAPTSVLVDGLDLPVPDEVRRRAPRDAGTRRLQVVAQNLVFRATEGIFDLDVLTKTGLMLLAQDTWIGRARCLAAQATWRLARPGTWRDAGARARRADVLRQSLRQYRRYRHALATQPMVDLPE